MVVRKLLFCYNETSGVNFTNVLRTTFMLVDPESVKNTVNHKYLFTPLGSMSAKAVLRTLVKLSPGVNFINVLREHFFVQTSFLCLEFGFE